MVNENVLRNIDTDKLQLPALPEGTEVAMVQKATPPPDPATIAVASEPAGEAKEGEDPRYIVGRFRDLPNYQCRFCAYSRLVEADVVDHYNKTHAPRAKAPTVVRSAYLVDKQGNPLRAVMEVNSNADNESDENDRTRNRSGSRRSADNERR